MERNLAISSKVMYAYILWPRNPTSRNLSQYRLANIWKKCMHKVIHYSTICNRKRLETVQTFTSKRLVKWTLVCPHNRITGTCAKEPGRSWYTTMEKFLKYTIKWEKQGREKYSFYFVTKIGIRSNIYQRMLESCQKDSGARLNRLPPTKDGTMWASIKMTTTVEWNTSNIIKSMSLWCYTNQKTHSPFWRLLESQLISLKIK